MLVTKSCDRESLASAKFEVLHLGWALPKIVPEADAEAYALGFVRYFGRAAKLENVSPNRNSC